MRQDPMQYWQEITENYRRMSDGQLLQLAEKPEDLTEVAQQALRDEMKLRKLDEKRPSTPSTRIVNVELRNYDLLAGPVADSYLVPTDPELSSEEDHDEPGNEFTWKTMLCECDELIEAQQISAVLHREGIDNWVQAMASYAIGVGNPRVIVAADQLKQAQAIISKPIPKDIIDELKVEVPEFEAPICPRCGLHDPILTSADPVNSWHCEACGAEWTDPEETPASERVE